ncbi:MAG: hypothetical protein ACSLEN_00205 [Candidatus Malihini olakiniferum]
MRGDVNKNEAHVEDVSYQHISTHDALIFNDILGSLDSSVSFLSKNKEEVMIFLLEKENIKGLDKFFTILSNPNNDPFAVNKIKQIFVMVKMLNKSYIQAGNPTPK